MGSPVAQRSQPLSLWPLGMSLMALILVIAILVFAVAGIYQAGDGFNLQPLSDRYLWHIVGFSCYEALLSVLLSAIIGLWLGRCLFFIKLRSLTLWLYLGSGCFVAPVILVVLGVVGAFGNHGLWARLTGSSWHIYGLTGILIAHLFLNIPLFCRHSYQLWQNIAPSQWQQAEQLGLTSWRCFCYLEWPLLRSALWGTFVLVFLLCFGSFTIVLALGGGPSATTLEVAIYQALKYDLAPNFALWCAFIQATIAVGLSLIVQKKSMVMRPNTQSEYSPHYSALEGILMRGSLLVAGVFFVSIMVGMFTALQQVVWSTFDWQMMCSATFMSLKIAGVSALSAILMMSGFSYLTLLSWRYKRWHRLATVSELLSSALLYLPPMVVSTGLFFWIWTHGVTATIWPMIALINALMALPFMQRLLLPAFEPLETHYRHLLLELGLNRWQTLRLVLVPMLARPLALAGAFALVLSLGDMGVAAMLGDVNLVTLPLLLYQQLSHYQFANASVTGLWLFTLCVMIFVLLGMLGEKVNANVRD